MAVSLKDFFSNTKEMRTIQSLSNLAEEDTNAHRMPIVYGEERFFASRKAAWGGFFIANKPWGYLDLKQRKSYFHQATAVFNKNFPTDATNAGHMIVTNHVHSAEDWRNRVVEKYADSATDAFPAYIRASQEAIERNEFFNKQTYLMVRLGERGDYKGFKGFVRQFMDTMTVSMGLDDAQPDETERELWATQSAQTYETLTASWLGAQPTSRDRIEWLVRHLDTPGLPTPDLSPADEQEWGIGKWQTTLAAYTEEVELGVDGKDRYKCVKFDAPTGTGISYTAYLALAHIPEKLHYGANWMHHASTLDFPVDISMHFEVVDSERAAKEISKPINAAENQYEEDIEAGFRPDDMTVQKNQTLREVKLKTQTQRDAMINWQCVFSVSAPTKEELLKKVARLRRHYTDIDFSLVCPNNDQRELFYQSLPGSDIIVNDWIQRTSAAYIGAAQPWLTSNVGSGDGFSTYQGFTVVTDANGAAQKGSPVFYDTQDIVDAQGKAPTEAVIGNPGAGKALSLSTLIPTPSGYVTMNDIREGQKVFSETGAICTVTQVHPIIEAPESYRVTFDDGTSIEACADHRWLTEDRAARMSMQKAERGFLKLRATNGKDALIDRLKQIIMTDDPEDTTTPTLFMNDLVKLNGNRGIYQAIARNLAPVGSYVQSNHNGGGRRYPMYSRVDFAKGMLAWAESHRNDQRFRNVFPQVRSTREIAESLRTPEGRLNHSVPLGGPINLPDASLPLDPYVLGAWLGDGRTNGIGAWASEDPEILFEIEKLGFDVKDLGPLNAHHTYYVKGLVTALRPLGVVGDKHIPAEYLRGSIDQRLALLQGLMDTDGSIDLRGGGEFYASDERLARQVRSLVASLGMKAHLRSKKGGYKTADGVRIECKTAWTVAFKPTMKVVRLQRKLERLNLDILNRANTTRRFIVSCEAIASVPMRCITVDSASSLYLAGDQFVPTHNTVSRGLKVVHEDALKGITQFVWDPKGDFRPLYENASRLMINPRKVNMIDIRNSRDSISLDAFAIAEVSEDIDERRTNAIDIFEGLSRKLLDDPNDRSVYSRVISTAVKMEMESGRPTMRGALERIRTWGLGDLAGAEFLQDSRKETWINCAQTLADHLDTYAQDTIGRLLFLDPAKGGLNAEPGSLTIFVAIGMEPTPEGGIPSTSSTIADVVSGCMADFIRSLLYRLPDEVPKSATFDEWHVIRRTRRAAALVDWLRRMGRSKRCIVRQLSQSAQDMDGGSLSAVWAGWVESDDEARASCKLVGIEDNEQNISTFLNLSKGEFMVRDAYGRVNRVKVEFWDDDLLDLFRTEATHKASRKNGPKDSTIDASAPQYFEPALATPAR